ncbi:hypothetical protein MAPG_06759 [Magnaporthiopsis poae ATCC 64411]|uniref:Uncharacterized protein n=1 Tax=Magnaporthiopsis poae (strain ATCC 64411 / 73-15) TaxID=644358 RepID=A0A0C4E2W7_MAGP6|nr:hypothetical protein MAPG_06759 [Magnaporthiopsis poae ATCC 64411]
MHVKDPSSPAPAWAEEPRPVLILQCIAFNFALPILYIALPHTTRPWLYRARLVVAAAVAVHNVVMARRSVATNVAVAYAIGLFASWSTIWAFAALVFLRPQFDAERVERRPRPPRPSSSSSSCSSPVLGRRVSGGIMVAPSPVFDLVSSPTAAYTSALDSSSPTGMSNGHGHPSNGHACNGNGSNGYTAAANGASPVLKSRRRKSVRFVVPPDDDVARGLIEDEYFWQAFPADAPFGTRLGWAFDYYMAWRGAGESTPVLMFWKLCTRSQTHAFRIIRLELGHILPSQIRPSCRTPFWGAGQN